jgi:hypothetical protein
MKIYLIYRDDDVEPFGIYHSAVIIAESEDAARLTHPDGFRYWDPGFNCWMLDSGGKDDDGLSEWRRPDDVKVEEIGTPREGAVPRIVCTNFMRY